MFTFVCLTTLSLLLILAKLPPVVRRRLLGHQLITDALLSIGVIFLFGATLTVSGLIIASGVGVALSATIFALYKLTRTERYNVRTRQWEEHLPRYRTLMPKRKHVFYWQTRRYRLKQWIRRNW